MFPEKALVFLCINQFDQRFFEIVIFSLTDIPRFVWHIFEFCWSNLMKITLEIVEQEFEFSFKKDFSTWCIIRNKLLQRMGWPYISLLLDAVYTCSVIQWLPLCFCCLFYIVTVLCQLFHSGPLVNLWEYCYILDRLITLTFLSGHVTITFGSVPVLLSFKFKFHTKFWWYH